VAAFQTSFLADVCEFSVFDTGGYGNPCVTGMTTCHSLSECDSRLRNYN